MGRRITISGPYEPRYGILALRQSVLEEKEITTHKVKQPRDKKGKFAQKKIKPKTVRLTKRQRLIDKENDDINSRWFAKFITVLILFVCSIPMITEVFAESNKKLVKPSGLLSAVISVETVDTVTLKKDGYEVIGIKEVYPVEVAEDSTKQTKNQSQAAEIKKDYAQILHDTMIQAGFNESQAQYAIRMIGKCENGRWDPNAVGVNKNGSADHGIMQINDYWHKKRFTKLYGDWNRIYDGHTNIEYAVYQIMVPQQNFSAWSCSRKVK